MLIIIALILAIGFFFVARQLAEMDRSADGRHAELVAVVRECSGKTVANATE